MDSPSESTRLLRGEGASLHNPPVSSEDTLTRHELAAWILDETVRGTPIQHRSNLPRTRTTRRAYLFFENSTPVRQLAALALVLLSFFELPSFCSPAHQCQSPDGSSLFLSGVPYLAPVTQAGINFVLLATLGLYLLYDDRILPGASLHARSRELAILLALLALDFFYVGAYGGFPPLRVAPFLRVLLPLFYFHSLRECTLGIAAVIPPFLDVVSIVALFTLVFGWLVTLLFHDVPEADRYFGSLTVGLYSAFTSLTTADWPMQIMAVLDVSRPSALLFLVFIVIGVFLLFNVLLAVVYNAYTGHIENIVVDKLQERRQSIGLAYEALVGEEDGQCTLPDMRLLVEELRKNKRHEDVNDERVGLLFTALDDDADENLSREEFLDIVDVLQLKFIIELESMSPMEKYFPNVFETQWWRGTADYVRSDRLNYHIGLVMIVNVAIVVLESTMDLQDTDTPRSVQLFAWVECAFSLVYIAEMVLKVASQGFDRYWRDLGNRFDFAVTWLLLFGAAYVVWPYTENDRDVVRYLVLLRCLRLFAVLADVPRFRRIVQVFSILVPASVPLFSFFFLSLYLFAAAGVELFGGLIYGGNPALDPTINGAVDAYVGNDYWALNFNDMASGWYTLFSAVIVAYLTEIAEAVASASKYGAWTKWFFLLSFVVNSLIVSNCVVAFVVDLFIMEDEQDDDITKLNLESRYGSKRVKVLQAKTTADQVYANMFRERVAQMFAADPPNV